jgi:hypothetical protein
MAIKKLQVLVCEDENEEVWRAISRCFGGSEEVDIYAARSAYEAFNQVDKRSVLHLAILDIQLKLFNLKWPITARDSEQSRLLMSIDDLDDKEEAFAKQLLEKMHMGDQSYKSFVNLPLNTVEGAWIWSEIYSKFKDSCVGFFYTAKLDVLQKLGFLKKFGHLNIYEVKVIDQEWEEKVKATLLEAQRAIMATDPEIDGSRLFTALNELKNLRDLSEIRRFLLEDCSRKVKVGDEEPKAVGLLDLPLKPNPPAKAASNIIELHPEDDYWVFRSLFPQYAAEFRRVITAESSIDPSLLIQHKVKELIDKIFDPSRLEIELYTDRLRILDKGYPVTSTIHLSKNPYVFNMGPKTGINYGRKIHALYNLLKLCQQRYGLPPSDPSLGAELHLVKVEEASGILDDFVLNQMKEKLGSGSKVVKELGIAAEDLAEVRETFKDEVQRSLLKEYEGKILRGILGIEERRGKHKLYVGSVKIMEQLEEITEKKVPIPVLQDLKQTIKETLDNLKGVVPDPFKKKQQEELLSKVRGLLGRALDRLEEI